MPSRQRVSLFRWQIRKTQFEVTANYRPALAADAVR